jgi:hypothetical protein
MFAVCSQAFAVQLTLFPTSVSLTCQLFILKEGIDWLDRIPRILFQIFFSFQNDLNALLL